MQFNRFAAGQKWLCRRCLTKSFLSQFLYISGFTPMSADESVTRPLPVTPVSTAALEITELLPGSISKQLIVWRLFLNCHEMKPRSLTKTPEITVRVRDQCEKVENEVLALLLDFECLPSRRGCFFCPSWLQMTLEVSPVVRLIPLCSHGKERGVNTQQLEDVIKTYSLTINLTTFHFKN